MVYSSDLKHDSFNITESEHVLITFVKSEQSKSIKEMPENIEQLEPMKEAQESIGQLVPTKEVEWSILNITPGKQVKESILEKHVVEAYPTPNELSRPNVEVNSLDIIPQSTETPSRLRSTEIVRVEDKNFSHLQIFDENEFREVENSVDKLTLSMLLSNWQVQTRKRANGTLDKFYRHKNLKKLFRSELEVKRYIRKTLYPQGKEFVDQYGIASHKRKRDLHSPPHQNALEAKIIEDRRAEAFKNKAGIEKFMHSSYENLQKSGCK